MLRERDRDARVAEAHRAAIGGLGPGLPQWREHGRDARVAEAHRAAIGGLGLPQWRGCGRDGRVAGGTSAGMGDTLAWRMHVSEVGSGTTQRTLVTV